MRSLQFFLGRFHRSTLASAMLSPPSAVEESFPRFRMKLVSRKPVRMKVNIRHWSRMTLTEQKWLKWFYPLALLYTSTSNRSWSRHTLPLHDLHNQTEPNTRFPPYSAWNTKRQLLHTRLQVGLRLLSLEVACCSVWPTLYWHSLCQLFTNTIATTHCYCFSPWSDFSGCTHTDTHSRRLSNDVQFNRHDNR